MDQADQAEGERVDGARSSHSDDEVSTSASDAGQPLRDSQLSEQEANEVYTALARAGIAARKVAIDKAWGIEVEAEDIPHSVEALNRVGLPRGRFSNLGEMFKIRADLEKVRQRRSAIAAGGQVVPADAVREPMQPLLYDEPAGNVQGWDGAR